MVTYPADWEKVKLADLIIKGGSGGTPNTSKEEYYKGRIPFLSISDITNSNGYIYRTEKSISELGLNSSAAWIVPAEALTLAMYASVGKVAILKKDIATSQAFYNMIFSGLGTRDFVYYYLKKFDRDNLWNPLISTGTQANLNAKKIRNLEIYLPPLPEQQAIAATLSYFDEHIDNLTELIEKKKAIRDGALEDLLSGRTRLDGFSGEWIKVELGEISELQDGTHGTFRRTNEGHYLLSAKNVFNNKLVITENESRVSDYDFEKITANGFPQIGDILMSCVGTIGRCCICDVDGLAFQRSVAFIRSRLVDNFFLLYVLQGASVQAQLLSSMNASAQGGIYLGALKRISLQIPVNATEQQAIAEILMAMDEEIESLETEKEKMMQIKEGAMDDLLTGRVRLKV